MSNKLYPVVPSRPGYDFTAADLKAADYSPESLGRLILDIENGMTVEGLLAAILKSQKKSNSKYTIIPFSLAVWQKQQLTGFDPIRNFLLIQVVGNGDLMTTFEAGNPAIEDFSATADSQNVLLNLQNQALGIVSGGSFFPDTVPINPITVFTTSVATQGVCLIGQ